MKAYLDKVNDEQTAILVAKQALETSNRDLTAEKMQLEERVKEIEAATKHHVEEVILLPCCLACGYGGIANPFSGSLICMECPVTRGDD